MSPRESAILIDKELGFNIPRIERELAYLYKTYNESSENNKNKKSFEGTHAWIGLHPQILQTPYSEIISFLNLLKEFSPTRIIDFGAGYGRVGIVMQAILPKAEFIGFEIVKERSDEGKRVFKDLGLDNCEMKVANIIASDFRIPKADMYFIYDFSEPRDLRVFLDRLCEKLNKDKFFIVARGAGVRSLIQNKYPELWASYGVIHHDNWSLYSSFHDLSL